MHIKHVASYKGISNNKKTDKRFNKPKIDFHPFSKNPQKKNANILSTYELLNILLNKIHTYKLSVLLYQYKNIFSTFAEDTAN